MRCYYCDEGLRVEFQRSGSDYWGQSTEYLLAKNKEKFMAYCEVARGFDYFISLLPECQLKTLLFAFCSTYQLTEENPTPGVDQVTSSLVLQHQSKEALAFSFAGHLLDVYKGDVSDKCLIINVILAWIIHKLYDELGDSIFAEADSSKRILLFKKDLVALLGYNSRRFNSKSFFYDVLEELMALVCYRNNSTENRWAISTVKRLKTTDSANKPVEILTLKLIDGGSYYSEGCFYFILNTRIF